MRLAAIAAEQTPSAAASGWLLSFSFAPPMSAVSDTRPSFTARDWLGKTLGSVLPRPQSSAQRKNRIRNISSCELPFRMEWASFGDGR